MARFSVLRERDFRIFWTGRLVSLLGSSMSLTATVFAVLRAGGTASGVGVVLGARTLPEALVVLAGGVAADRLGRRRVIIGTDAARCAAQAGFAAALFLGATSIWLFAVFAAVGGAAEGVFGPTISGLTAELVPPARLGDANALTGIAGSASRIAGPALAGALITMASPAVAVALDAASYAGSVLALAAVGVPPASPHGRGRSPWRDLADGWAEFRAHRWLLPSTLEFTFLNMLAWGPFLLLGPVACAQSADGAAAWGAIMAAYGAGSVAGGLLALGRRPRRPIAVSVAVTVGYGLPCAALALGMPLAVTAALTAAAGMGSAISSALAITVVQRRIPRERISRVRSVQRLMSLSASPVGLALAGPAAAVAGAKTVLAISAICSVVTVLATLALPSIGGRAASGGAPPADTAPGEGGTREKGATASRAAAPAAPRQA